MKFKKNSVRYIKWLFTKAKNINKYRLYHDTIRFSLTNIAAINTSYLLKNQKHKLSFLYE